MGAIGTMMETTSAESQISSRPTLGSRFKALMTRLNWMLKIQRSRLSLRDLTDDQLADIGISRHEAELEAQKIRLF
jgi:uncharacterized protein YjiS (DUF1127 family)